MTNSSIKSRHSDEVLPSKSPASTESDLDISLSSQQEDVCKVIEETCSGSTELDKPTDLDQFLSSQDDNCKGKKEPHNNSMEAETHRVSANQEEHNDTEAKADAESSTLPVESQEEALLVPNSSEVFL